MTTITAVDPNYDSSGDILCRPGGPRHVNTPGPYCAPLRCYCPGRVTIPRGPRTTVDGHPVLLNDPLEGERRKAVGMHRALDAREAWRQRARAAVLALAALGEPFTSEDVVDRVGLPAGGVGTNANNAVGALMSSAARANVIEPTGRHVRCRHAHSNARELKEWRGVTHGRMVGQ